MRPQGCEQDHVETIRSHAQAKRYETTCPDTKRKTNRRRSPCISGLLVQIHERTACMPHGLAIYAPRRMEPFVASNLGIKLLVEMQVCRVESSLQLRGSNQSCRSV